MEFMLLWWDNLDDALCALRHLAPSILGFVVAIALVVATGVALAVSPQTTLALLSVTASVGMLAVLSRRRLHPDAA